MKLTWSPRARDDIEAIFDFIAEHNKPAATRVVSEIRRAPRV
jgi:plasmid stabilization system protein ParE